MSDATQSTPNASLYEQLGGEPAVNAAVNPYGDLYVPSPLPSGEANFPLRKGVVSFNILPLNPKR